MPYQAVRRILASPVYVARPPQGDPDVLARPVGRWPALVDDATWRRVREQVEGHRRLPRQASQRYLLTGLLRCPACGTRMHGRRRVDRGRSIDARRQTQGRTPAASGCLAEVLGTPVDAAVLAEVAAGGGLRDLRRAGAARGDRAGVGGAPAADRRLDGTGRATPEAPGAGGRAGPGTADEGGGPVRRRRHSTRTATSCCGTGRAPTSGRPRRSGSVWADFRPDPDLPPLETVLRAAGGWAAALRKGDVAAQREVLVLLLERAVPRRVGYGRYEAEIAWTPLGEALVALGVAAVEDAVA